MIYRALADLVVVLHLGFVLFVILGGLLVFKYPRCVWLHIPAFLWAAVISFMGWVCPLTPLENWLRHQSGAAVYESGFIKHYIVPVLYPSALTRDLQVLLGVFVLVLNAVVYAVVLQHRLHRE